MMNESKVRTSKKEGQSIVIYIYGDKYCDIKRNGRKSIKIILEEVHGQFHLDYFFPGIGKKGPRICDSDRIGLYHVGGRNDE